MDCVWGGGEVLGGLCGEEVRCWVDCVWGGEVLGGLCVGR